MSLVPSIPSIFSFPFLSSSLLSSPPRSSPVTLYLSIHCVALFFIILTFPFLHFLLSMLNTSGGIHSCALCTFPTQHPSCVPHLTAVRLPLGVFEVIPSCSGTARWCCWSAAPWHGGWHPARAPHTRSPAGPTAAGEGFGPSGWWVGPLRPEWEFPQSEGAEGSPVETTFNKTRHCTTYCQKTCSFFHVGIYLQYLYVFLSVCMLLSKPVCL